MLLADLTALGQALDAAVPPLGGPPLVTGPVLNATLHHLVATLGTRSQVSLLFAHGDELVGPDFYPEPACLRAVALSPGATGLAVSVDDGASFVALPLAAGASTWAGELALPAGASVWYQATFAAGAGSAGAVLTVEAPAPAAALPTTIL